MKKEDNMLESKTTCGRISAWVYKKFEIKKSVYFRTRHCVLTFNYTDKREAALFYQYFV